MEVWLVTLTGQRAGRPCLFYAVVAGPPERVDALANMEAHLQDPAWRWSGSAQMSRVDDEADEPGIVWAAFQRTDEAG
ncbi:MAG: hypothetical protein HY660_17330 [Armatimonadetes bacterium]|nr:hypothetical protein [Armatimonadota bacterium]